MMMMAMVVMAVMMVAIMIMAGIAHGNEFAPCLPPDVSLTYLMPFASQLPPATQSFLSTLRACGLGQSPCLPAHIDVPEHIRLMLPKHMQDMPACAPKEIVKTGARLGDNVGGDWYDDVEKDMMNLENIPEYSPLKKHRSCPTNCTCQEVPGHCEWLVDCRGLNLGRMPEDIDTDTDCIDIGDNNLTLANLYLDSLPYYLTHLELSFNPLGLDEDGNRVTLPGHLFEFPKLYVLGLTSCNISSVSEVAFAGLMNITIIQLSDNNITTLPPALLHPVPTLKMLLLDHNNISSLPTGFFKAQTDLLGVIMHSNKFPPSLVEQWKQSDSPEFMGLGVQSLSALKQWDIDYDSGDDVLNDLLMRGPGADKHPEMEKYMRTLQAAVDKVKEETTADGREDIATVLTGLRSMDPDFWREMIRTELKKGHDAEKTGAPSTSTTDQDELSDETLRSFFEAMNVNVDTPPSSAEAASSGDDDSDDDSDSDSADSDTSPPPPAAADAATQQQSSATPAAKDEL